MTLEQVLKYLKDCAEGKYGTKFSYLDNRTAQAMYDAFSEVKTNIKTTGVPCSDYETDLH